MASVVAADSLRLSGARGASLSAADDAHASSRAGASERELVRRAKGGSVEAFGALVERYEGRVLSLLRFRVRPEVEAEDVAQETFLRAWTRLDGFDESRPLAPWLLTIAARTAVGHNRKARSRRGMLDRLEGIRGSREPGVEERYADADRSIWEVARGCLSDETVTALWLRYGEEMSMREIGTALGRSEIHVRVMLSRARKRLAKRLSDTGARQRRADGEESGERGGEVSHG